MTNDDTKINNAGVDRPSGGDTSSKKSLDPRTELGRWANDQDEWVRLIVSEVIATGHPANSSIIDSAYQLLRQEKAIDDRQLPTIPKLTIEARQDESALPLSLSRLSEVRGVNALISGAVIEPHDGLTILYGENGTGKTGYSRIFKALANSRTVDTILGDIEAKEFESQAATLEFILGEEKQTLSWDGTQGVSPFTRMSIFDSPAVRAHVDDDLEYVYTPASLGLFNDVATAMQGVTSKIEAAIADLGSRDSKLLSRFQRGSSIYPLIETLGTSTDLTSLKEMAKFGNDAENQLDDLGATVGGLRANTLLSQITALKSQQRVLVQALSAVDALLTFDKTTYNESLRKHAQLETDYETFRTGLFAAADLPAEPDETWNGFIEAGDSYRQHLVEIQSHDAERCLYCRQSLLKPARDLIERYSTYLEDKISDDIRATIGTLGEFRSQISGIENAEMEAFIAEHKLTNVDDRPSYFYAVESIESVRKLVALAIADGQVVSVDTSKLTASVRSMIESEKSLATTSIADLEDQQQNRSRLLEEKQLELLEFKDAVEVGRSWPSIETQAGRAKEAEQLQDLKGSIPKIARSITDLAKIVSDQMVNQNFDALFLEECDILRAPRMKIQFVGRGGKAHRRKVLTGKHKPSKVFSEGEQKVLAIADFLAEARLSGITAPVIFDDPVSSLDHRRVNEVAQRIVKLAINNQVIVFTHDILFATTLLGLSDKSKRCSLFHITDENGKGQVDRATGLRTDSLNAIKGRINSGIQNARTQTGDVRDALVRTTYSHIRAWCEVFTEDELLRGVTKRYRANVQMSTLPSIDGDRLNKIGPKVNEIFEIACRFIDGHSQPLVTLGVSPTLTGLEQHWSELKGLKELHDQKV